MSSEYASFQFYRTPRVRFGVGVFAALAEEAARFGKKALVVTVPGKPFGMEGHLRMSYSTTVKDVTEGLERIRWALDPNAPNEIYIGDRKLTRDWL